MDSVPATCRGKRLNAAPQSSQRNAKLSGNNLCELCALCGEIYPFKFVDITPSDNLRGGNQYADLVRIRKRPYEAMPGGGARMRLRARRGSMRRNMRGWVREI